MDRTTFRPPTCGRSSGSHIDIHVWPLRLIERFSFLWQGRAIPRYEARHSLFYPITFPKASRLIDPPSSNFHRFILGEINPAFARPGSPYDGPIGSVALHVYASSFPYKFEQKNEIGRKGDFLI